MAVAVEPAEWPGWADGDGLTSRRAEIDALTGLATVRCK
jgi:hypothetical protein